MFNSKLRYTLILLNTNCILRDLLLNVSYYCIYIKKKKIAICTSICLVDIDISIIIMRRPVFLLNEK